MPVPTTPPAITAPDPGYQAQTPLMSQMIQRAVAENQLTDIPSSPPPQPTPSDGSSDKWPVIAALAGGALDTATTQMGLAKGGIEMNPMLPQNRLGNGLALGGSYLGAALLSHLLSTHGHPTLGKIVGYGAGADGALFGAHNIGTLRSLNQR